MNRKTFISSLFLLLITVQPKLTPSTHISTAPEGKPVTQADAPLSRVPSAIANQRPGSKAIPEGRYVMEGSNLVYKQTVTLQITTK